jgi:hypothetical protein
VVENCRGGRGRRRKRKEGRGRGKRKILKLTWK